MRKRPEILRRMTRSEAQWISPNEDLLARLDAPMAAMDRAWRLARFLENRWLPVVFMALWATANFVLFTHGILRDRAGRIPNPLMQIGRATGVLLSLNSALILIPVMRRMLTRVRASWLGRAIPSTKPSSFIASSDMRSSASGSRTAPRSSRASLPGIPRSITEDLAIQLHCRRHRPRCSASSQSCGRVALGHPALEPLRALLLHASPLRRVVRRSRSSTRRASRSGPASRWSASSIEQRARLAARVARSVIARAARCAPASRGSSSGTPAGFTFHAAATTSFLRIPAIAGHEWHPFTISSAAESEALTFHVVRSATGRRRCDGGSKSRRATGESPLAFYVDGPYGSPSAHIFDSRIRGVHRRGHRRDAVRERAREPRPPRATRHPSARKGALLLAQSRSVLVRVVHRAARELETQTTRAAARHPSLHDGRARPARPRSASSSRARSCTPRPRRHGHGPANEDAHGPPDWERMLYLIAKQHAPEKVDVFFCGPSGSRRSCDDLRETRHGVSHGAVLMRRSITNLLLWLAMVLVASLWVACQSNAHQDTSSARCASCHMPEYLRARHPVHVDQRPTTCGVCHTETSWRPSVINHPWPLTGAHAHVTCFDCHIGKPPVFEGTSDACVECHRTDFDRSTFPGHSRFPTTCADCHSTNAWTPAREPTTSESPPIIVPAHEPSRVTPSAVHHRAPAPSTTHAHANPSPAPQPEITPPAPETPPTPPEPTPTHPESQFPIQSGHHAGISCMRCHDQGGTMGRGNTDCVQCHPRADFDGIHQFVGGYPRGAARPNFCVGCHSRGTRSRN